MSPLIVPVVLDVLMVRSQGKGEDWADTAMREPKPQANRRVRQQLEADPFATREEGRAPGAYLHWALPDALTKGEALDDRLKLPPAPDRWMILRLSTPAGETRRRLDAWYIPDSGAEQPIVIGDVLAGGEDIGSMPEPAGELTALGVGSIGWAAYFDNVEGRFALHDDLEGVEGAVAYAVCGWYADPEHDPIASASESEFLARLEDHEWALARPLANGEATPQSCVFHGYALALGWPEPGWAGDGGWIGHETDYRPDGGAIELAIGETLAEALVAVIANDLDLASARVLEARLSGLIGDSVAPDGLARIESKVGAARFGSIPSEETSETIWEPDPADADHAGAFRTVGRSGPRRWQAANPAIVLQGAGRSGKHGGDGRFGENDELLCRLETDLVTAFGVEGGDPGEGTVLLPASMLSGVPADYGVPPVVESLLIELACLDPASAPDLEPETTNDGSPVARVRADWWQSFVEGEPEEQHLTGASIKGILPSPIAVTTPSRPWSALHLDWTVSYIPSAHGTRDWELVDADFSLPDEISLPGEDLTRHFSGRSLLNTGAAQMVEFVLDDSQPEETPFLDLVGGALEGFTSQLRGDSRLAIVTADQHRLSDPMPKGPRPEGFLPLRAGFLRIDRLRIVDAFGQYIDLVDSDEELAPKAAIGKSLVVPGHPALAALRPRFTAPAQVSLRFVDAVASQAEANEGISPVCGFILPSPRDSSMEVFDADGFGLGRLRPDRETGTAWEETPGQPASLGARPGNRIGNATLGMFADGILAADTANRIDHSVVPDGPTTLSTLLQIIDAARWSTDLTGPAGDEHLSLILGQPAAIVRASIRIDVFDERDPPENATTAVPVRLGSLAQFSDGLLGYFIDDDYRTLRLIDPGVAEVARALDNGPLLDGFIDETGLFYINPGITVMLTLIMVPGSDLQVTTGVLPQKQIGLLREWTAAGLSRLSPTLRFGPVLRDEEATRIPLASDIRGDWTWHRRADPVNWANDEVVPATTAAQLPEGTALASDGWLQVELIPDLDYEEGRIGVHIRYVTKGEGGVIETIGGINPDGSVFMMPVGEAVRLQQSGRFRFYVRQGDGPEVSLNIVQMRNGRTYMRTNADRRDTNNLENLPPPPP